MVEASARPRAFIRRTGRSWVLGAGATITALVLVACGGGDGDADDGGSAGTASPPVATEPATTATASPPGEPTAPPQASPRADEVQELTGLAETDAFRIQLPEGWFGYDVAAHGADRVYDALVERAPYVPILDAGPAPLNDAAFWAFEPVPGELFVSNLNVVISRGSDAPETAEELRSILVAGYEAQGITVEESDHTLTINGRPAVMLLGDMSSVVGDLVYSTQYVVMGEHAMYALSYAVHGNDLDTYAPLFRQSAETFEER